MSPFPGLAEGDALLPKPSIRGNVRELSLLAFSAVAESSPPFVKLLLSHPDAVVGDFKDFAGGFWPPSPDFGGAGVVRICHELNKGNVGVRENVPGVVLEEVGPESEGPLLEE